MMDGPKEDEARPIVVEQKEEPAYCMSIEEDERKNEEGEWYSDILQYPKMGHTYHLRIRMTNWPSEGCPLIILFVGRGFTEDHMLEFTSFVWLPRKHSK